MMCKDIVPRIQEMGYECIPVDYSDSYEGKKSISDWLTLQEIFYMLGTQKDGVTKILISADKFLLSRVPKINWVAYNGLEVALESKFS